MKDEQVAETLKPYNEQALKILLHMVMAAVAFAIHYWINDFNTIVLLMIGGAAHVYSTVIILDNEEVQKPPYKFFLGIRNIAIQMAFVSALLALARLYMTS